MENIFNFSEISSGQFQQLSVNFEPWLSTWKRIIHILRLKMISFLLCWPRILSIKWRPLIHSKFVTSPLLLFFFSPFFFKKKKLHSSFLPSFDLNLVIVHPIVHTIIRLYIISENEYPNDLKRLSSDVMSYAIKSKTIQIHLNVSEHVQFIRLFSKPNSCVSNKESGNFEQNLCGIYAQTLTALPVDQ